MATNNAANEQFVNNTDGFGLGGGTTSRTLTVTGGNVTLTGSGTNTYTFPAATDTLVGRASTDTLTNKTIAAANNTITGLGIAALGGITGTPSSTTYLRGDGTWATPSGSGGISRSITSISTATTAGATASTDYVYYVSGTTILTLPTAVGNTNRYTIKNTGTATVTVATTTSQTIDGSTTITLPVQYASVDVISDNTNWNIV